MMMRDKKAANAANCRLLEKLQSNFLVNEIDARLAVLLDHCQNISLREAMSYSIFAGGKRLRPMLLLGSCEAALGRYTQEALDFACALEMIHTYSLIHDDLPAMDNDDFRRGKPTSHKQFGEAMAILAGDALLNRAFETMTQVCTRTNDPKNLEAMLVIISAAGDNGMIAGQTDDIHFQHKKLDESTLFSIHCKKTGALFSAAFEAGAILGGENTSYVQAMKRVGAQLGWAFQILDDLLDVTSTQEDLGKPVHSDSRNQKNTYVSVHGLDKAKNDYSKISAEALAGLDLLTQKTPALRTIVQQVIDRER